MERRKMSQDCWSFWESITLLKAENMALEEHHGYRTHTARGTTKADGDLASKPTSYVPLGESFPFLGNKLLYLQNRDKLVAKVCFQDNLTSWVWKHFEAIKSHNNKEWALLFLLLLGKKRYLIFNIRCNMVLLCQMNETDQWGAFWRETWVCTSIVCVNCNLVKAFIQILELEIVAYKV